MSRKKQTHEFTRSQLFAISLTTLALLTSTFALGYKAGAMQINTIESSPSQFLPNFEEQASLEELIRQIESNDHIPAKDYIFHEELEAQSFPLGLTSSNASLEKTKLLSQKHLDPKEPEITKITLPTSGWSVQVGSFPTLEEAEDLIADLAEKELEAYYVVALINNQNWYRVRIGGYNSKSIAQKAKSSLQSKLGGKDYLIQKAP